jgi:hypothetical protein
MASSTLFSILLTALPKFSSQFSPKIPPDDGDRVANPSQVSLSGFGMTVPERAVRKRSGEPLLELNKTLTRLRG